MLKTINTSATAPPSGNLRPQLTMSISFINKTGRTITVIWKSGHNAVLRPMLDTNSSGIFTILVTYSFNNDTIINSLPQTFELEGSERRLFEEAMKTGTRSGNTITVAYQIPFEDLDGCRGVYHDILDLVITTKRNEDVPQHPRSVGSTTNSFIPQRNEGMINYRIVVNDKHRRFSKRFVNIMGIVLEAPTIQLPTMPDGIYVAYTAHAVADAHWYAFNDEACPLKFWHSHAEAQANGDTLEINKYDQEVRKHELKMLELEANRKKVEIELSQKIRTQQLEDENARIEANEREVEHQRKLKESNQKTREADIKHQYEEQSAVRKNTSEWLKIVPSLLGFAGLAFGMYKSKM